ncbi:ankyrin repeat-containing domain protein [Baffinella frigidus]|nr:ankyrin repeat-containing domain protein [Cryptophyta sp. CCMP2293]
MACETFPADMLAGDAKPCPLLWHACKNGFHDKVYALLSEQGVDNEERGGRYHTTPLMIASRHYRLEIVKLLLETSADITAQDDRGMTAVHLAVSEQHLEVVMVLVSAGAGVGDVVGVPGPWCKTNNRHLRLVEGLRGHTGGDVYCEPYSTAVY